MDKLYIIIPAYNEEETVAAAIAQWHPMAEQAGADCGLLIGCRTCRQDGLSRILVTKALRLALLASFHVWLKDANSPYRLMGCRQLQEVLRNVPKNFFLSNVLISVLYAKKNLGVSYYPISFLPRQGGKNSINIRGIFKIGLTSLRQFFALQSIWEKEKAIPNKHR